MKRLIPLVLVGLVLTGCAASSASAPPADPYQTAMVTCMSAYAKAPEWTEDLGGPKAACDNWEESQGKDAFTDFWSDTDKWTAYMENVYILEEN